MAEKIVVGPINRGLRTDRTAFVIDNDSFPTLLNAYQWRGRVKRKRGTVSLGRLSRYFDSSSTAYNPLSATLTLDAAGSGNILTGWVSGGIRIDLLQKTGNIVPGTVTIIGSVGPVTYTDITQNGYLTPTGTGGPNTINYSTGVIVIPAQAGNTVTVKMTYYPGLPGLGWEDLAISNYYPGTLAFDNKYSYNVTTNFPPDIYDVSFYKNPTSSGTFVEKALETPTSWNGLDYQQFWSTNYAGAFWVCNGVTSPFSSANVGMQFASATGTGTIDIISSPSRDSATTFIVTITNCPLIIGDFVFFNEWSGSTTANSQTLNFQTGYVTACSPNSPALANKTLTVTFPSSSIAADTYTPGIIQYLTNRSDVTLDCIRFYDGDPTSGAITPPILNGIHGWVNFMPPLSQGIYSIGGLPPAQYYLVGAKVIIPFKDRLLFFAPVVQSSTTGPFYLQDTCIWSSIGSPYYTSSFQGSPINPTVNSYILVPSQETSFPAQYFEDQTGFAGFASAGLSQEINTVGPNEDVLIIGFSRFQQRFIYTDNNADPFKFYTINSELGSGSTFSSVIMDKGIISKGSRGYVITSQVDAQRLDLEIPDQVFETDLSSNGAQRVCAIRDFINEWVFFTYPSNQDNYIFPTQTLQWNYRDNTWGIHNEAYTTYGLWRTQSGYTWSTLTYLTWDDWDDTWDSGEDTLFNPKVVGMNQQGFILRKDEDTDEAVSLNIQSISYAVSITGASQATFAILNVVSTFSPGQFITISDVVGMTQLNGHTYKILSVTADTVTIDVNSSAFTAYISGGTASPLGLIYCPNHCLNDADYFIVNGCIGSIGQYLNGKVFSANVIDINTINLIPGIGTGTYFGGGTITRMYIPQIMTKQFPVSWADARKTRLGPQQYLFTTTNNAQITLYIFLSQNSTTPYNLWPNFPSPDSFNEAIIYNTVLYTCPESTNLGLTPSNINLQMVTAQLQDQTWHRMNTSLIGDTVQIGFTLSDTQMQSFTIGGTPFSVTGATNAYPCVLTCDSNFSSGDMIQIQGVFSNPGTFIHQVISSDSTTVTINVDSTLFGASTGSGKATQVSNVNQFAEIELHSFILSVSPSMVLA